MPFDIRAAMANVCTLLHKYEYKQTLPFEAFSELPRESPLYLKSRYVNAVAGVKLEFEATVGVDPATATPDQLRYSCHSLTIETKVRTDRGTYIRGARYDFTRYYNNATVSANLRMSEAEIKTKINSDLEKWLCGINTMLAATKGQEVTNPAIKRKNALYQPLRFATSTYHANEEQTFIMSRQILRNAKVLNIVSISNDLKVNTTGITKPDEECWFHIRGDIAETSSTAEFVATEREGELVFYPIGGSKITNNFAPRNMPVDYQKMTIADGELVRLVINQYLERLKQ